MNEGNTNSKDIDKLNITTISILSRSMRFLPHTIVNISLVIEIFIKMLLKAAKERPDVIHCHDTIVLPLAVFLKIVTRSKLIYDAHELESNRNGLSKSSSKLTIYLETMLWSFIDALITVSPSINHWYMSNLGEKVSAIILNSPLLENSKEHESDNNNYFRKKYTIPVNSLVFIYVGLLSKGRGIEKIIAVFSKKNTQSHVVFMGYGDLTESIQQSTKLNLNIHYHDAVPHEQVVNIIKSADIGLCLIEDVSLSDYYSLPNKLFEYCFAGIPILASQFPDIYKIVEKYRLGMCCKLDEINISKAVNELEKIKELPTIDEGDLFDLSWEAQGEKLVKLYDKLLDIKEQPQIST